MSTNFSILKFALLTACFVEMCFPKFLLKLFSQIGHLCGSSIMNSGASLLHVVHNLFQLALSCAVCAQILRSSSGKPFSTAFAFDTKFLRRPVLSCDRPSEKPKRVWRANRVGAIHATCPNHRVDLLPAKASQSGTPNICAHFSFVMRSSRMRTQEMSNMCRILLYQNL